MKTQFLILAMGVLLAGFSLDANARHPDRHYERDAIYIPLRRGTERVNLKTMLRRQGVDTDHYLIRGVKVHTEKHGRRHHRRHARHYDGWYNNGSAVLRVGRYYSDRVFLDGRRTFIPAPDAHGGRWRLYFDGYTPVRGVTVVLTPKPRYAYHGPRRDYWQHDHRSARAIKRRHRH